MNIKQEKKSIPVWAWGIGLFYTSFVLVFAGFAIYSTHLGFQFVTPDYYKDSVNYQKHIMARQRAQSLAEKPTLIYNAKEQNITLEIPVTFTSGKLFFYRPNDHKQDRSQVLSNQATQVFSVQDYSKGKWKMQLTWQTNGKSYYQEKELYITN